MTVFFETMYGSLKIVAKTGDEEPKLENNVLTLSGYTGSYDNFRTVDLYLNENIIQVGTATCYGGDYRYKSSYYVLDYGVFNWRTYNDMSVIKNLEKLDPKIFPKKERHKIELNFGRSEKGKEALEKLIEDIKGNFQTTSYGEPIRVRPWDQTKEILIDPKKTKSTFYASTQIFNELIQFVSNRGYEEGAEILKKQRAKAVFQRIEVSADLSKNFVKQKKLKK